ncbi:hypothetical protein C1646_760835 [Rhizophagus diaphanus]|nr:hypothetical protein C1646_760835 [Rhizophagus diaphanus] [Rhizophagus sp. MUCL 43196]
MVAPHIRLSQSAEYRENYIIQKNKLWCRFCNIEIDHERKNSIDKHIKLKHLNNKNKNNSNLLIQRTLPSFENTLNEREKINKEIVKAFTYADIPLEKIEKLKPFLLNHCKNAGLITGANQLCEKYLPLSYEIALQKLKNDVINKIICLTIDETTDRCGRHAINILFSFDNKTKLAKTEFFMDEPLYSHLITFVTAEYSINHDSKQKKQGYSSICLFTNSTLQAFLSLRTRNPPISNEIFQLLNEENQDIASFVLLFSRAFILANEKCEKHISHHPALLFFKAIQCFDPRFIQSNSSNHNMENYRIIKEFYLPTDTLIQEWAIYCELNESIEEFDDLDLYWRDIERSFSSYKSILSDRRVAFKEENIQMLNFLYFNLSNNDDYNNELMIYE